MTVQLTKRVRYVINERLDLLDKVAEDELLQAELEESREQVVAATDDGRILKGFKTSTTTGPNLGFTIPAGEGAAFDRAGALCLMDGLTSLTETLDTNAINYIHLYFDEDESDNANRKVYSGSAEVTTPINTRYTRTCKLYRATAAYGTPSLGGFTTSAVVGGVSRHLIPLYAVPVNVSDSVTSVEDFRPMFAPAIGDTGGNKYDDIGGNPDLPFNFTPSDVATIGITDMRSGLVALASRIAQMKNKVAWWEDNFCSIVVDASSGTDTTLHLTANSTKAHIHLVPLASAPSSPTEGDIYADNTLHKLLYYNGTAWVVGEGKVYSTETALLADTPDDSTFGYAEDTDNFWFRRNSTWSEASSDQSPLLNATNNFTSTNVFDDAVNLRRNDPNAFISVYPQGGTGSREWWLGATRSGSGIAAAGHFFIWDQTASALRLSIKETGHLVLNGYSSLISPSDGVLRISDNAGTGGCKLQMGPASNRFVMLSYYDPGSPYIPLMQVRVGDDTTGAKCQAYAFYADGGSGEGIFEVPTDGGFTCYNRSRIHCSADGYWEFFNNAKNDCLGLRLGGTSSSEPMVSRSGATLTARLADNSDYANFFADNIRVEPTSAFFWSARSRMKSGSDGYIDLLNYAQSDFYGLRFGGTTSSYGMIKHVSAVLQARLADDSGYTRMEASNIYAPPAVEMPDLLGASTDVQRIVCLKAGTVDALYSVLEKAPLAGGDVTITASINGTPMTGGVITITQSGSAIGDVDLATPTAANVVAEGDVIELTVGGSNTDSTAKARVSIRIV